MEVVLAWWTTIASSRTAMSTWRPASLAISEGCWPSLGRASRRRRPRHVAAVLRGEIAASSSTMTAADLPLSHRPSARESVVEENAGSRRRWPSMIWSAGRSSRRALSSLAVVPVALPARSPPRGSDAHALPCRRRSWRRRSRPSTALHRLEGLGLVPRKSLSEVMRPPACSTAPIGLWEKLSPCRAVEHAAPPRLAIARERMSLH